MTPSSLEPPRSRAGLRARAWLSAGLGLLALVAGCKSEPPGGTPPPQPEGGTERCGDGIAQAGEQCDDGNLEGGDGCSATCERETPDSCGDGTQQAGEQCDDGNLEDGDGCDATCAVEVNPCGDTAACADGCCAAGEACFADTLCLPAQSCTTSDDCRYDTTCVAGECVPFELGDTEAYDVACVVQATLSELSPEVQCTWEGPPDEDAFPTYDQVMATPMVVDFDADSDPDTLDPSIVVPTFGPSAPGARLRVLSGRTCEQQWSLDGDGDEVALTAPVAVGDLDADGRAEIVASAAQGGLLAFQLDTASGEFVRLWETSLCEGDLRTPDRDTYSSSWAGPSLIDLDDDGRPEVIFDRIVWDADGCLLSDSLGRQSSYSLGYLPVLADVDADGRIELVQGNALHEWDPALGDWQVEPTFDATGLSSGQVAVAEMGDYPVAARGGEDYPEVVVISGGQARVQTIAGEVVFGPLALPLGGSGGPPTVADFDGDGRREFSAAGGSAYTVFDLDCVDGGDPAGCAGEARTTGVLWSQASQDLSSNVTGSSVFDFDANGVAEVVYADECYFRVYDGATGEVIASVGNTSNTTFENPVVVDVDGDFRSEVVIASNDAWTSPAKCADPDPLFPATAYTPTRGVTVLREKNDQWAASRPVWNQHAYAVTHVGDHGETIPTSEIARNWEDPLLNNFRQNAQGSLTALGLADLTLGEPRVQCDGELAVVTTPVCNRGTLPAPGGLEIRFSQDDAALCSVGTERALEVGECLEVSCSADLGEGGVMVTIEADPGAVVVECFEQNNLGQAAAPDCSGSGVVR